MVNRDLSPFLFPAGRFSDVWRCPRPQVPEAALREFHVPGLPACRRIVTIDPAGRMLLPNAGPHLAAIPARPSSSQATASLLLRRRRGFLLGRGRRRSRRLDRNRRRASRLPDRHRNAEQPPLAVDRREQKLEIDLRGHGGKNPAMRMKPLASICGSSDSCGSIAATPDRSRLSLRSLAKISDSRAAVLAWKPGAPMSRSTV